MTYRKTPHSLSQIQAAIDEVERQGDRGAALILAGILDETLEVLISARLIELSKDRYKSIFGRGRPLDSFSAKIDFAFALGVISNEARIQLDIVRDVRNSFAHRIEPLQFDSPEVLAILDRTPLAHMPPGLTPRERFSAVSWNLAVLLHGTALADIRMRHIQETHAEYIRGLVEAVLKRAVTQGREKPE